MMIKYFHQGKGDGKHIIDYLLSPEKHKNIKPEIVKGSEVITREAILSSDKKHRYTTGVISFANGELIATKQQIDLMNEFERTFAPFEDQSRMNFLWVRHIDKGRLELHFVCSRQDLKSGLSFNIRPPGKAQNLFNDLFVACKNFEYGFQQVDKKYCSVENYNQKKELLAQFVNQRKAYIIDRYDRIKIKRVYHGNRRNNNNIFTKSSNSNSSNRKQIVFNGVSVKSSSIKSDRLQQLLSSNGRTDKENGLSNNSIEAGNKTTAGRGNNRSQSYDLPTQSGFSGLEKVGISLSSIDNQLGSLYLKLQNAPFDQKVNIQNQINNLLAQREKLLIQIEQQKVIALNSHKFK
ncbi:relaxase/mobilization nuclease domain-containing protein [Burkholderia multivorans]|uniref:relaxase/mobilization nuclease domain-containing protein n=1 Tax=Burkholderia multivorans TaxID=87883 RepID=UPI001C2661A9|nr:relaxase/mobilization nuclease domain-containing protein [Burkholderia multivorans]MBU9542861.1 relaxase/mobilization nuclease domain-containing protein [Burkholderia multivorans]